MGPLSHSPPPLVLCLHPLSLWPREQEIMEEILVLREAAEKYEIKPKKKFWTWFWAVEQLSLREG